MLRDVMCMYTPQYMHIIGHFSVVQKRGAHILSRDTGSTPCTTVLIVCYFTAQWKSEE